VRDWRPLALVAVLLGTILWWHAHRPIPHGPGVVAPDIPLQESLDGKPAPWSKNNVTIEPLAKFSISARVLSRADYSWDTEAAIAPIDLALGWGRMSDSAVLQKVDISQSGRFYFWHVNEFPIPEREIIESSANMHLVPADRIVEHEMKETRPGDVVSFSGYLIEARWLNGYKWISSLTRSDTGAGACELVWVEHFDISPRH
jgi:hypothetical protein